MFKLTQVTSAVLFAIASQGLLAQENTQPENANDSSTEVIQVTGIRGSLNQALNIKRQEVQVVDAIVSEDIGKFPDNNVVEALQRVTGVQTTGREGGEVSTVSIRGLTDVNTTVNGRRVFTGIGRSVALADIPASLISQVSVYKTRSASQLEEGIAGSIDIKTQRPFNFEGEKAMIAARGIYSEQAGEADPNLSALYSNRWTLDNGGEFGALINVSYAQTHWRTQGLQSGALVPFMGSNPTAPFRPFERVFNERENVTGADGGKSLWTAGTNGGLPTAAGSTLAINGEENEYYLSRDAVIANDVQGLRKRPALNLSMQWAPNDKLELLGEIFYNGYRNEDTSSMFFTYTDWWTDPNFNDLTPEQANVATYVGTNIVKSRDCNRCSDFSSGGYDKASTDTWLYSLGAKLYITDDLTLNSELTYQTSKYDWQYTAMRFTGQSYGMSIDYNADDGLPSLVYKDDPTTADVDESDMRNLGRWRSGDIWDNGGKDEGDAVSFTSDANWYIGSDYIDNVKFGLRYDKRTAATWARDNASSNVLQHLDESGNNVYSSTYIADMGNFEYSDVITNEDSDFYDGKVNFPKNWAVADGKALNRNLVGMRSLYNMDEEFLEKNFDIEQVNTAFYAQTDYTLGYRLSGQIGARYVNYETDMTFIDNDVNDVSSADSSIHKVLPSFVARYQITDDLLARFAYTETLRMPDFNSLNSFVTYVDDVSNLGYGTAAGGNPDLKPTESKNYDLSLEWYFSQGSSVYASLFKRDIQGFVVNSRKVIQYAKPGQEEYPYVLSAPQNASDGKLKGVELGLIYFPDNLPESLDGLGIQASYTALDSEQSVADTNREGEIIGYTVRDLAGVSDSSYSVVLAYDKEVFDMRLSYVWREAFYVTDESAQFANPIEIWNRPEKSLDFQLSYDVSDELMVTVDATNLTDEIAQSYYGKGNQNTMNTTNGLIGRTFAVGMRYSF